ncbi:hypothetical protein B4U79_17260 [Dinothrombium tinctorium]|uniref:Tyrosinase copper-binding domain-containing protein n=1 Tax=Dinothrombium tinctorium TaxID=1965070 RepID=A0A443RHX3_9ACAR|nr:hypothetical protein B4U79_17260 [Dinothrombium tinctorium]
MVKLLIALPLFAFVLVIADAATTNRCPSYCRYKLGTKAPNTTLRVRKDIKCMTEKEWKDFADAVTELHARGIFDRYNFVHVRYFYVIHDSAQFFPWHRWFLFLFENELRKINPTVTIPYWDGAVDFVHPELSEVFNATRAGGSGDPNDNFCVKDGLVAGWIRQFPSKVCVKRNFGSEPMVWHSPEWTTHLLQAGLDYDSFREGLEFSMHALMHGAVGGPQGELMWPWGPNDIIFFFLHANIDRIWAKWQLADPQNFYDYGGPLRDISTNTTVGLADQSDKLDPWDMETKEALVFGREPMPYTYDEFLSDVAEKEETEGIKRIKQLPKVVLQRYYPKIIDGTATRFHYELPPTCGEEILPFFPPPVPINPLTLAVRGFNADRAMRVQADSNSLVETLNLVGYQSPYV